MKKQLVVVMGAVVLAVCVACLIVVSVAWAQEAAEMPEMPKPQKEHEWLQQLVGKWETKSEMLMPGMDPIQGKGTEKVRSLGGFWVLAEGTGSVEGMEGTMESVMTLGYDPGTQRYVGTWFGSMDSTLWEYEGTVDESGKVLTLETRGPCPMQGEKITNFREVMEFKDQDHRVFTSSYQEDDGKWVEMMRAESTRVK